MQHDSAHTVDLLHSMPEGIAADSQAYEIRDF